MKAWYAQKTLWAGIGLIATGVAKLVSGGDTADGITTIVMGLAVITGRQAIEGVKK